MGASQGQNLKQPSTKPMLKDEAVERRNQLACLFLCSFAPSSLPLSLPKDAFAPSPLCSKHSPFERVRHSLGDNGAASGDGGSSGAEALNSSNLPLGDQGVSSSSRPDRDKGAGSSRGGDGARRGTGAAREHGRTHRVRGAGGGQHRDRGSCGEGGNGEMWRRMQRDGVRGKKKVNSFSVFFLRRRRRRRLTF